MQPPTQRMVFGWLLVFLEMVNVCDGKSWGKVWSFEFPGNHTKPRTEYWRAFFNEVAAFKSYCKASSCPDGDVPEALDNLG